MLHNVQHRALPVAIDWPQK